MQENQNPSDEPQDRNQKDRVRDFFSRPEITGIAIAFWFFVGSFFLLRFYIYSHIPNDPERTKVLIETLFSLVLGIVVIIQAGIYFRQAEFMKQQATTLEGQKEIADRLATTALKQFEITDRPWLAVDVVLISPLTFTEQGGNVTFLITAKNVGRSVAVNASINAAVIVPVLGGNVWDSVLAEQTRLCQNIHSEFMSYAIFPDGVYGLNSGFGISPQDLDRGRLMDTDFIQIYLVGCADYQFSGHEAHHQTRFIYEVHRTDPAHPGIRLGIIRGQDTPLERLILDKMIVGRGDYAD